MKLPGRSTGSPVHLPLALYRPLRRALPQISGTGGRPASAGITGAFQSGQVAARIRELVTCAQPLFPPGLVFAGSFLVYFLTAAPTLFGWDSAEFAATAYTLGVPHATGYPTFVLLGKLFTFLPIGDIAYRLNLMSAFFAAATVTVVYLTSFFLTRRMILSVAAAGALAFSYFFWASAVVTEVYALHAFLNAATIYLLLLWRSGGRDRLLYAGIFAWGLSFGNHMTTVLMGPAVGFLVVMGIWERRITGRHLLPLAVCFLAPLTVYLYLPLRYLADAVPYVMSYYTADGELVRTNPTTLQGMWEVITARQFAGFFRAHQGPQYIDQLGQLMFTVYANFLGAGLALGLLGIIRNFLVDKGRLIFLGLIFLTTMLFFADYGAMDKYFMFVTGYIVWSIWIAEGFYLVFSRMESSWPDGWPARLRGASARRPRRVRWEALSLLLLVAALWVNFSYTNLSSFTHFQDTYPGIMESFEPNALVLAWWADVSPMQYYQQVEGLRPDIQLIDRWLISPENEIELINSSLPHRPVYVFEGHIRHVPHPKIEVPYLRGSLETGYRVIPP